MPKPYYFPESFLKTNLEQRNAAATEWLKNLPSILDEAESRWSLTIGPPFPQLSYNYAAPATRADGTTVVVKAGVPNKEFRTEAEALQIYGGDGAVRILDFDLSMGVMLLEYLRPGKMLVDLEDDVEATSIAASVMKRLWHAPPPEHSFPTVFDWVGGFSRLRDCFGGGTGPFPRALVEEAERLFADLLASMGEQVVLHGDLHHFNILSAEREPWLVIDPQGVIGEAEYETGALLRNPMPELFLWPGLEKLLARRIDQLAEELGFDRERIRGWAVAQAVLSVWWYFDETCDSPASVWKGGVEFAETLARVH